MLIKKCEQQTEKTMMRARARAPPPSPGPPPPTRPPPFTFNKSNVQTENKCNVLGDEGLG